MSTFAGTSYARRSAYNDSASATELAQLQQLTTNTKLLLETNPWLSQAPDSLMTLAGSGMDPVMMMDNNAAMAGLQHMDQVATALQSLSPVAQSASYSKMTEQQQRALAQLGYALPDQPEDKSPFESIMGGIADVAAPVVGLAAKPLAATIGPALGKAFDALTWIGDVPGHFYRVIRQMESWQQWVALGVAVGSLALAPATLGASAALGLGTLSSLGVVGGVALGAATASTALTSVTDLGEWWDVMKNKDGERIFTKGAKSKAQTILGNADHLDSMARNIAANMDLEDLAEEFAGVGDATNINVLTASIERVALTMAETGTPEYEAVYAGLATLIEQPEFRQAIDTLQNGKISFGRDVAQAFGMQPGDTGYNIVSGGMDAAWLMALDPMLLAGTAGKLMRVTRRGVNVALEADGMARIAEIVAKDDAVGAVFDQVAKAMATDNFAALPKQWHSMHEGMRQWAVAGRAQGRNIEWTRDEVLKFIGEGDGMKAILEGKATITGLEAVVLSKNTPSAGWGKYVNELRQFRDGVSDTTMYARAEELAKKFGVTDELSVAVPSDYFEQQVGMLWAHREMGASYRAGEAVGKKLVLVPGGKSVSEFMTSITTMIPPSKSLRLVGEGSESDIPRFVETFGREFNVPSYARDEWLNMIMHQGTIAERRAVVTSFMDSSMRASGMHSTDKLKMISDEFIGKFNQAYGSGGLDLGAGGVLGDIRQKMGLYPDAHQAIEFVVPQMREMARAIRNGSILRNVARVTDADFAEQALSRFWKPSVLLRIGFIPRAAGEEMLAFFMRVGEGSLIQEMAAQSVGKGELYHEAVELLAEAGGDISKLSTEARAALKMQYPTHLRPLVAMGERTGWKPFSEQTLDGHVTWMRRQMADGMGWDFVDNIPDWAKPLIMGREHSWRNMVANGVDRDLVEASKKWTVRHADPIMKATSSLNASKAEKRVVNPDQAVLLKYDPLNPQVRIETPVVMRGERGFVDANHPLYLSGTAHRMSEWRGDEILNDLLPRHAAYLLPENRVLLNQPQVAKAIDLSRNVQTRAGRKIFNDLLVPDTETMRQTAWALEHKLNEPELAAAYRAAIKSGDVSVTSVAQRIDDEAAVIEMERVKLIAAGPADTRTLGELDAEMEALDKKVKELRRYSGELRATQELMAGMEVLTPKERHWMSQAISHDMSQPGGGAYSGQQLRAMYRDGEIVEDVAETVTTVSRPTNILYRGVPNMMTLRPNPDGTLTILPQLQSHYGEGGRAISFGTESPHALVYSASGVDSGVDSDYLTGTLLQVDADKFYALFGTTHDEVLAAGQHSFFDPNLGVHAKPRLLENGEISLYAGKPISDIPVTPEAIDAWSGFRADFEDALRARADEEFDKLRSTQQLELEAELASQYPQEAAEEAYLAWEAGEEAPAARRDIMNMVQEAAIEAGETGGPALGPIYDAVMAQRDRIFARARHTKVPLPDEALEWFEKSLQTTLKPYLKNQSPETLAEVDELVNFAVTAMRGVPASADPRVATDLLKQLFTQLPDQFKGVLLNSKTEAPVMMAFEDRMRDVWVSNDARFHRAISEEQVRVATGDGNQVIDEVLEELDKIFSPDPMPVEYDEITLPAGSWQLTGTQDMMQMVADVPQGTRHTRKVAGLSGVFIDDIGIDDVLLDFGAVLDEFVAGIPAHELANIGPFLDSLDAIFRNGGWMKPAEALGSLNTQGVEHTAELFSKLMLDEISEGIPRYNAWGEIANQVQEEREPIAAAIAARAGLSRASLETPVRTYEGAYTDPINGMIQSIATRGAGGFHDAVTTVTPGYQAWSPMYEDLDAMKQGMVNDLTAMLMRPENQTRVAGAGWMKTTADGRTVAKPIDSALARTYVPLVPDDITPVRNAIETARLGGGDREDVMLEAAQRLLDNVGQSRINNDIVDALTPDQQQLIIAGVLDKISASRKYDQPITMALDGVAFDDPRVARWVSSVISGKSVENSVAVQRVGALDMPRTAITSGGQDVNGVRLDGDFGRAGKRYITDQRYEPQVMMMDNDHLVSMADGSVMPGVSPETATKLYAESIVEEAINRLRVGERQYMRPRDAGDGRTYVGRKVGDKAEELEVGEKVEGLHDLHLLDEEGNVLGPVEWGDPRYFEAETQHTGTDLMWEAFAPMLRDANEDVSGLATRVPFELAQDLDKSTQLVSDVPDLDQEVFVRRFRTSSLGDVEGGALPNVSITETYKELPNTAWDRTVRYGFDKIIGPMIDSMARKPMSFHYFASAYKQNKQALTWMLDAGLFDNVNVEFAEVLTAMTGAGTLEASQAADARLVAKTMYGVDLDGASDDAVKAWLISLSKDNRAYRANMGETARAARAAAATEAAQGIPASWAGGDVAELVEQVIDQQVSWRISEAADRLVGVSPDALAMTANVTGVDGMSPAHQLVAAYNDAVPAEIWDEGHDAVVAFLTEKVPDMPHSFTPEQWRLLKAARQNMAHTLDTIEETAALRAIWNVEPFLDSHEQRTIFAELGRNMLPFWYAEENFLKRWARTLHTGGAFGLDTLRKAQLAYMGIKSAGIVRTDVNGKDWFVYPGSGLLIEAVGKIPGVGDTAPMGVLFAASTDSILPGINENIGSASPSPFVAIPTDLVLRLFPDSTDVRRALLGDITATNGAITQLIPTTVRRAWDAVYSDEESSSRYASAMLSAIAFSEASDQGLPEGATPAQMEEYLDRMRNHARIIMISQALSGFVSPGSPVAMSSGANKGLDSLSWLTGVGIEDPREVTNAMYREYVGNLGVDAGTQAFLAAMPSADLEDITSPEAFTTSMSSSASAAPLPATRTGLKWYTDHQKWVDSSPEAGAWFLPPDQDGEVFDFYSYSQQLANGLRKQRTPGEFLTAIKYRQGADVYFTQREKYEDTAIQLANDQDTKRQLDEAWDLWKSTFFAAHPIFAEEIQAGDGRQRRERTIEQMRYAVNDPNAPASPNTEGIRQMVNAFDKYKAMYALLGQSRDAVSVEKLRNLKSGFEDWVTAWTIRNPSLERMWSSVYKPESGLS